MGLSSVLEVKEVPKPLLGITGHKDPGRSWQLFRSSVGSFFPTPQQCLGVFYLNRAKTFKINVIPLIILFPLLFLS